METVLILCARRYQFRDDQGRNVEGVTLSYVTDDLQIGGDRLGLEPLTVTAPLELFQSLTQVPGVYQMDFRQRPGPKGRPVLQVAAVAFLRPSQVASELAAA
jgi:hypothetical protein